MEGARRIYSRVRAALPLRQVLDWRRRERLFKAFVSRISSLPSDIARPRIAVVVQPWLLSDVPWYSLLLAFGLRRRGCRVVLIWDDIPWDRGLAADGMVNASIGRVLARLGPGWEVQRLSGH